MWFDGRPFHVVERLLWFDGRPFHVVVDVLSEPVQPSSGLVLVTSLYSSQALLVCSVVLFSQLAFVLNTMNIDTVYISFIHLSIIKL